jgi:thioredoxin-dependent peroxiredoxin
MAELTEGAKAPAFKSKDQNGNTISLSDYKGKKLILFFYPKDSTPTCTVEVCNLRDNYALLQKNGFELLGVSIDNEKSHQKFITKNNLPFPLLTDTDLKIVNAYKIWVEKKLYGRTYMGTARTTFIIDEKGKIEHIIDKVNSKDHAGQILALVDSR